MFWRKFKLDWSYAIVELGIVTLGVLIALGIDEWNDERLERVEEIDVISRIIFEVDTDLQNFEIRLEGVDRKEDSLLRVRSAILHGAPQEPNAFLRDIIVGADYGWNQGLAQRATFDDLLGAGRLRIIGNPEIRSQIANYYLLYEDSHMRMEERETAYPGLSYQLVPRRISWSDGGVAWERDIEADIAEEQLNDLVRSIHESSIGNYVTAELNLARFIRAITKENQGRAASLVDQLEEYKAAID
jgi:hypothetical protein